MRDEEEFSEAGCIIQTTSLGHDLIVDIHLQYYKASILLSRRFDQISCMPFQVTRAAVSTYVSQKQISFPGLRSKLSK